MAYNTLHNQLKPDGEYGMYLRKSRTDVEAESHGAGETLLRHHNDLIKLAKKMGIRINKKYIYREVVSGETISARPEVQRMLNDVSIGVLSGVFVMEIERLARGDTSDQGHVAKAFKQYNTLIITPSKVYEPDNEADEEYFEFGLFMSRREYKTINRRIQNGRVTSASEGKYVASVAPFGYEKVKISNDKGYTLKLIPDQAAVIKSIYEWYSVGVLQENGSYLKLGATRISDRLNEMGIKPVKNDLWTKSSVIDILHNPVYIGKIRWGYKKEKKYITDNRLHKKRYKSDVYSLVDGLHEAIINIDLFNKVQELISSHSQIPVPGGNILKNSFSGLIYCKKCGRMMTRLAKSNKTPYDTIKCMNKNCDNISSPLYVVEDVIITSLKQWLNNVKIRWNYEKLDNPYANTINLKTSVINQSKNELSKLIIQRDRLYSLLEQDVYSIDVFKQRNKKLSKEINDLEESISKYKYQLDTMRNQSLHNDIFIPKAELILDTYFELDSSVARNEALKGILEKIEYEKNEPNKRGNRENKNFEIELFPKVIKF